MNLDQIMSSALPGDRVCPHCAHAIPGHAAGATFSGSTDDSICPTYDCLRSGKVVLIGVGGPSAAGKSTLARSLGDQFAATENDVFFMDRFFDRSKIYEELRGNWEQPAAVNEQVCLMLFFETIRSSARHGFTTQCVYVGHTALFRVVPFSAFDLYVSICGIRPSSLTEIPAPPAHQNFHRSMPAVAALVGLSEPAHCTHRRWFPVVLLARSGTSVCSATLSQWHV